MKSTTSIRMNLMMHGVSFNNMTLSNAVLDNLCRVICTSIINNNNFKNRRKKPALTLNILLYYRLA